ncbi:hypothetical protein CVT26_015455 [Gymnopilus dilepis]|uniref:Uncharacterized protein n=1 Tax=Gymnopilus dilepis TaxID=231916 RepID=A0A409W4C7_9AGAR|nr:hypothetical protein CVT26_015455 [Gymnopilus dilepis]
MGTPCKTWDVRLDCASIVNDVEERSYLTLSHLTCIHANLISDPASKTHDEQAVNEAIILYRQLAGLTTRKATKRSWALTGAQPYDSIRTTSRRLRSPDFRFPEITVISTRDPWQLRDQRQEDYSMEHLLESKNVSFGHDVEVEGVAIGGELQRPDPKPVCEGM